MTALLIILIFAIFAALMMTRRMPAILAVPAMAIAIAAVTRTPLHQILNEVIAAGATRLVEAYLMVFAGAMLGRVVMQTGIAEGIIRRAAEFGGDKPLAVAITMMIAVALLFTTLTGLGAVMMVGGLALPIMMSIGVPRKLAGVLFLLAYGLGYVFNIAAWGFYQKTLNLDPQAVKGFAAALLLIDAVAIIVFLIIAARRMNRYGAWAVAVDEEKESEQKSKRSVMLVALLIPLLPAGTAPWPEMAGDACVLRQRAAWRSDHAATRKRAPAFQCCRARHGRCGTRDHSDDRDRHAAQCDETASGAGFTATVDSEHQFSLAIYLSDRFRTALTAGALSWPAQSLRHRHRSLFADRQPRIIAATRIAGGHDERRAGAERLRPDEHAQRLGGELRRQARRRDHARNDHPEDGSVCGGVDCRDRNVFEVVSMPQSFAFVTERLSDYSDH